MLNTKQERAIEHLLTAKTHKEAAQKAGVSLATLYRYKQDYEFQAAYRERKKELFEGITNGLQCTSFEAIETLKEVMKNPSAAAMARVTAASKVLDLSYQSLDRDVLEKEIEELKDIVIQLMEDKQ